MVGQIAAQIGPYNLLWCRRYKKIVPTRRYYRGERRANYRRANCLKYCKQIKYLKYLLGYRRYKKFVLFWRNRTRLANAPTPEQIILTYLRCHLTYQSACVNSWTRGKQGRMLFYAFDHKQSVEPLSTTQRIGVQVYNLGEPQKYYRFWRRHFTVDNNALKPVLEFQRVELLSDYGLGFLFLMKFKN